MGREIKFRAWHTKEKAMLFVGDAFGTTHPLHCAAYAIQGQPVELMQCTGIKDRNGREIYEGDVVKCCDWGTSGGFICNSVVEWCNDEKGWTLIPDPTAGARYDLFRNIEVIGNIYENPELKG